MAAKKDKKDKKDATESKGQGRAVTLPNGQRRIDYIRDAFYNNETKRGEIRTAINEMLEKANRTDEQIAYQIVFAATKTKEDPRLAKKEDAKD